MRVYISTPINGRSEATFEEKYAAAEERCTKIIVKLRQTLLFRDAIFTSTFDNKELGIDDESVAMGMCVTKVMEADFVVFDYGWCASHGCIVEHCVSLEYDKIIAHVSDFSIGEYDI